MALDGLGSIFFFLGIRCSTARSARPKLLGHGRSGKHARRTPITFSYGWHFSADVGRLSDGITTVYRTAVNVQYAPKPEESIDHILLQCSYAREVWFKCFRRCGW
jgi:hypothetical protein